MLNLITWYCICAICCSHTHGITKSGYKGIPGLTAACDRSMLGSVIWIEGLGFRICEDTGSKIKGNRVDVLVHSHDEALRLGKQKKEVQVIL